MSNDPIYPLKPVFNFLDALIRDHGDYLYVVFAHVCVVVIVWILCGGLRRRQARRDPASAIHLIVIHSAVKPPPLPPTIGENPDRKEWASQDDDSSTLTA